MLNINYDILLNDEGRPYIYLPPDYRDNPEDRFFALEITRYMLNMVLVNRKDKFDDNTKINLNETLKTLELISDEVADLLKQQMEFLGDVDNLIENKYSFSVENKQELFDLNYEGILRNDKIYKRKIGLKVLVRNEMQIYELMDGIDNENWKRIVV